MKGKLVASVVLGAFLVAYVCAAEASFAAVNPCCEEHAATSKIPAGDCCQLTSPDLEYLPKAKLVSFDPLKALNTVLAVPARAFDGFAARAAFVSDGPLCNTSPPPLYILHASFLI